MPRRSWSWSRLADAVTAPPWGPDHRRSLGRKEATRTAAVITGAAACVYGPHVVRGGRYYDDWAIVAQLHLASDHGLGAIYHAARRTSHRPGLGTTIFLDFLAGRVHTVPYLVIALLTTAVTTWLLYVLLRLVGIRAVVAGAVAAVFLVLPAIDAVRLWWAAQPTQVALALAFAGTILILLAIRAATPLATGVLHVAAAGVMLTAVLTDEIVVPVVLLSGVAITAGAGLRAALRRWPADVVCSAIGLMMISRKATEFRHPQTSPGYLVDRVWPTLTVARKTFTGMLPGGNRPAVLLTAAIIGVAGCAMALRQDAARGAVRQWILIGSFGAVGGVAGLAMLLPADPYYVPRSSGVSNRFGLASSPSAAILMVALAALLGLGLGALWQRRSAGALAGLAGITLMMGVLVQQEWHSQRGWATAWHQGRQTVARLDRALPPQLPSNAVIVTFHHPMLLEPYDVPVLATWWDVGGVLQLLTHDPTIRGFPYTAGLRCRPTSLVTDVFADVIRYDNLWFVDVAAASSHRVGSQAECLSWLTRIS